MSDVERLLTLVNGAALHKALREQGVGVSYRTVARWIGATPTARPPAEILPALEAVLGTTKEAAPPEWAERLEAKVDSILERQSVVGETYARQVIEALVSPELMEWQARIAERLAELPPQADVSPGDSGEVPGAGSSGRRALEPS